MMMMMSKCCTTTAFFPETNSNLLLRRRRRLVVAVEPKTTTTTTRRRRARECYQQQHQQRGGVLRRCGVVVPKANATEKGGGHCDVDEGYVGGSAIRTPKDTTVRLGDSTITIETQKVGLQANGAVVVTEGDTVVYCTVCAGRELSADGGWVPLTVNYTERFSAAGKFSGGFKKRDGSLKEGETLKSRIVDRPIRPLIPKGFGYDTQILEWVLSYDNERTTDALAICAASAALAVSDVPLKTPVMGCRVGYIDGKFVANPTKEEMETSRMDLVMAGTKEAVLMIEGFGDFLTTEEMIAGIACGQEEIARAAREIEEWAREVGKEKIGGDMLIQTPEGIDEKVEALVGEDLKEAMLIPIKKVRGKAIGDLRQKAVDALKKDTGESDGFDSAQIEQACGRIESAALREAIRTNGRRQDGRKLTHIRPIVAECGVLPRTHGSALFTRGETQCYSVTTLGGKSDEQRVDDALEDGTDKRFMLHYFFPPSSVGECGRVGGANRREIGHGNLAERALLPIIPNGEDFPFTIKIESTVTESNGSSSMATVCGGCLALQDAGVPIKRKVAGVAMGLILGDEKHPEAIILTDILGSEDALGDMDFKCAGDSDGFTAFQMDIKVEGITLDVMRNALEEARLGIVHVLGEMEKSNPAPRGKIGAYAPQISKISVNPKFIGKVIGKGGETIKNIVEKTGVSSIDVDDSGNVTITGPGGCDMEGARETIEGICLEPEVGKIYRNCEVKKILEFGCFVEIFPGVDGLCHISELEVGRVATVNDVVKEGEKIDVKLLEINGRGQMKLSRREVLLEEDPELAGDDNQERGRRPAPEQGRGRGRGGRGNGRGPRRDSGGFDMVDNLN